MGASPLAKFTFILLQFLVYCSRQDVSAIKVIDYLPGFHGPLPFYLETGYVQIDEVNDAQLFYYFIKSERDPVNDALIVWLTGGPGCSAFSGLVYEIGPLKFDVGGYKEGQLPTLLYNPNSWTKVSSIIFLDSPVGTGFSYSTKKEGLKTSDTKSSMDVVNFLKKWYAYHPEFLKNQLYIGGDSYSGILVPIVAKYIADGNNKKNDIFMNIKGCLVGNGVTDQNYDGEALVPYVHGMGLISDELYESTKRNCGGEYRFPKNEQCSNKLQQVQQNLFLINTVHILEPLCFFFAITMHRQTIIDRRKLFDEEIRMLHFPKSDLPQCRTADYLLSYNWTNNGTVREALGIHEGTVPMWMRCNYGGLAFTPDVDSSLEYHKYLTSNGYRALIYSGDHDMSVPFIGTQAWIRSLNSSIVDEWRSWFVDFQVAGYTRTYANNITFVTIKGGGHTAPEYKPKECLAMVERWLDYLPL